MAVESPTRSAISPLRFFNRTARVSQPGSVDAKNKLIEIDSTLKKILSIRKIEINTTRLKKEDDKRIEKENKLEAGKFIVKGIGKLANNIPGKNTIQKFLIFMAFGWLYNTFSKYFDQFVGPLSTLINFSAKIIDVFAKITFSIFDGIVTFIDLGYKAWDVIRGKEDAEKLESAMNDVLLGVDRLFGGILTTLGILEQPINESPVGSGAPVTPKSQQQAPPPPDQAPSAPGAPGAQPQTPMVPQAPGQTFTGGIVPSTILGSKAGMRKHPLSGEMKMHRGNDYPIDPGTQISVLKGGKVTRSEVNGSMTSGYGNLIEIQHDDGSKSVYAHLQLRNVSVGDNVKPGTIIGTVGSTGGVTGAHLHFEYDNPNGSPEHSWSTINSKADQIFRFGSNVKPSDTHKLALKNGVEGEVVNGKWRAKKWTNEEKDRYRKVLGLKGENKEEQVSSASVSGDDMDKRILDFIAKGEEDPNDPYGGFNTSSGRTPGRAVDKTIGWLVNNANGAIGRYQHMPDYLMERARASGFNENTKFTPEVQDKITLKFLKDSHSYNEWKSGKISDEQFLTKLAPTWRAIPQGPINAARLGGSPNGTYNDRWASRNASGNGWSSRISQLRQIKSQPAPSVAKPQPSSAKPQASSAKPQASSAKPQASSAKPQAKPERWAIDPRGWFGMKGGGAIEPPKSKKTDTSLLSTYPSYSEGGGSMMVIQPIIIEKMVPVQTSKSKTSFPVIGGVNSSGMNNFRG